MKIAVVILNWNGRKILEKFLPSVTQHTTGDAEVIVADNGSTDDSLEFLAQQYPSLRVIKLDKNYGFAEGYNRALAQIEADYYVLLNDDVEVTEGWITPVIDQMEQDEKIAICQPKLKMYNERDRFEYAGGAGGFLDQYGYPFCRGRIFTTIEYDHGQYDDPCDIFWASGAAMFVKAKIWREIGGLDGDFFAHMEEIDFCWRAQNHGYRVQYCPKSVVYHVGGGTLPKSSPLKTRLNFRNNLSMLYKNLTDQHLHKVIRCRKILDGIAAAKFLLSGNRAEYSAVFSAHSEYRKQMENLKRKRDLLPHKEPDTMYHGLILVDYYLRKRKTFDQLNILNKE
ncbi:MAG: glycosyltransferase family 2 protein [Bacteroidales bacterium]|nr:glycosyltransferase family 2 protein [Bacteroidales bacterium]